eukprot:6198176-Pleurochrysis_carterae.AAC.2
MSERRARAFPGTHESLSDWAKNERRLELAEAHRCRQSEGSSGSWSSSTNEATEVLRGMREVASSARLNCERFLPVVMRNADRCAGVLLPFGVRM